MHQSYLDAMTVVQVHRKPDLFVTMTCNPNWIEITDHLRFTEAAGDRPDLTARVFKMKLDTVLNDIYNNGIFGKVVAHINVIEFQKRGLPHSHILIINTNFGKQTIMTILYVQNYRIQSPNPDFTV